MEQKTEKPAPMIIKRCKWLQNDLEEYSSFCIFTGEINPECCICDKFEPSN